MSCALKNSRWAWLALGLVGGAVTVLVLSGWWPNTPLHAVATDRCESFAMATGPLDNEIEAVYFLDFLTGDLKAFVLSRQLGKFRARYSANVNVALGVDPSQNPRYLMVTGVADMQRSTRGPGVSPSRAVLYVGEITRGRVAAYAIPWMANDHAMGRTVDAELTLLHAIPFRGTGVAVEPVHGKKKG